MSLSSHNNLSVGSKKIKKTRQMRGGALVESTTGYPFTCLVQGYCRLNCKTKGGNWTLQYLESQTRCFFLKGRYPEGPGEAVPADLLDNLHLTNFLP